MDKEQIKLFLKEYPGYLKEGKRRLQQVLKNKGYTSSLNECANAIRERRNDIYKLAELKEKEEQSLKVLVYDIETSYNITSSWRVGYNLNLPHYSIIKERAIICVSYKWKGSDETFNIQWDENQCDKKLLQEFIPILNEADLIVAHNGDRFDLKWIKTRALKHDLPMLINYPQFDTLKVAKKKFYFNSNKLDYISEFLGFGNKKKTEPELWDKIILNKDSDAMDEMVAYCNEDVALLEKVYDRLVEWEYPKLHVGALKALDHISSPITGGKNLELVKTSTTTKGTIKRIMRCKDTGRIFEFSNTSYKKFLETKK
jgi:DNA polymerase elongation subunit (family B)